MRFKDGLVARVEAHLLGEKRFDSRQQYHGINKAFDGVLIPLIKDCWVVQRWAEVIKIPIVFLCMHHRLPANIELLFFQCGIVENTF